MALLHVPRLLIGGMYSGVGKSLFALGLTVALRKRGVSLACCVVGPRLQQAILFHRLSRRYTRCLDSRILSEQQLVDAIRQASRGADLVLIDGRGGLFDSDGVDSLAGSDAQIAALTGTPVAMVADVTSMGATLAAIVHGFTNFSKDVLMGAVLGTRTPTTSPEELRELSNFFSALLHRRNLAPYLGHLPVLGQATKLPGGSFSQRVNQTSLPMQLFVEVGNAVSAYVDIDRLLAVAQAAPPLMVEGHDPAPSVRKGRIAVTEDTCFSVAFQDNLDLLRFYGCELVPFSPLADSELPDRIGGLYVTGAFLDDYGVDIAQNRSLGESILSFARRGGVIYSEGAGTAYLCSTFQSPAEPAPLPGVGLLAGDAVLVGQPPSYVEAQISEDAILGLVGWKVRGIAGGEWGVRNLQTGPKGNAIESLKLSSELAREVPEGYSPTSQSLSTFSLLHFGSNHRVARALAEAVQVASSRPSEA